MDDRHPNTPGADTPETDPCLPGVLARNRAEKITIGGALFSAVKENGIPSEAQRVEPDAFEAPELRIIWRALTEMVAAGEAVDLLTIEKRVLSLGTSTWPADPHPTPVDVCNTAMEAATSFASKQDFQAAVRQLLDADYSRRIALQADAVQTYAKQGRHDLVRQHTQRQTALVDAQAQGGGTLRDRWRPLAEVGADWLTEAPPERDYLLSYGDDAMKGDYATERYGVLPRGKVGMLAAAGGVGKTHALTALAVAVATGTDWLGDFHVDAPGKVALLLAEEERQEVQRRLYYAAKAMNLSDAQRADALINIIPIGLAGELVSLADETGGPTLFAGEIHARLQAGGPWALVVMDPLSRFGGPEMEKDNAVATRVVQVLERFTRSPGTPTVLVAHHTTKEERKAQQNRTQGATTTGARGSSALTDGVRWVAAIQPMALDGKKADAYEGPDLLKIKITKSNYGRKPPGVWLYRPEGYEGALVRARSADVDEYAEAKKATGGAGRNGGGSAPGKTAEDQARQFTGKKP